jgi:GTP cyclohydrolase I
MTKDKDDKSPLISNDGDIPDAVPDHQQVDRGPDPHTQEHDKVPDAVPVVEILGGSIKDVHAELRPTGISDTPMAEGWEAPEGTEVPVVIREVGGHQVEEFDHIITPDEYHQLADRGLNTESSGDSIRAALVDIRQQAEVGESAPSMLTSGYLGPDPALSEQAEHDISTEGAVRVLLRRVVWEDPEREGLLDTPERVVKALGQMTEGYGQDPVEILGTTFDTEGYDEMVVLRGIDFVSLCEHHMLPFTGTAAVGYVPGDRVVGLSKLARLVDCFARRLQIQERMTKEIADAVMNVLSPQGVGVVVSARHSCMGCRGVRKPGASMVTSYLAGVMRDNVAARAEFLALAGVTK